MAKDHFNQGNDCDTCVHKYMYRGDVEAIDNLDRTNRRLLGGEMVQMDIYASGYFGEEQEKRFEAVEAALGFKLFAWQKTYIVHGQFRRYGATTAEILRELMQVDNFPLDYTKKPKTQREAWYRGFLREIKQQLDGAGVPTREVFFNQQQKRAYMENPENQRKERERYQEARWEGTPARLWR